MRKFFTVLTVGAVSAAATLMAAPNGDLRLVEAAKTQNQGALKSLLKAKADANVADVDGMTPLIWAAHQNDLESVKLLLAAGANAKVANRYEVTALSEAANNGNSEMIEALLNAGANPNVTSGEGETPLMTASRTGATAGVKALIAKGANVNAKESYRGQTPLMWAVAENHSAIVEQLINAGAEVNARSTVYDFSFRKVAAGGTSAVYSKGGLTALMLAARQGSIDSAKILLAHGAQIEDTEPDFNFTPLLEAIFNDHYDMAAFLMDHKADPKAGALYLTVEMRNLDYQGNRPRKAVSDKMDELAFMKYLLDHGVDPNGSMAARIPPRASQNAPVNVNGNTPFLRAARSADIDAMKLLLEYKADPNKAAADHTTPVVAAGLGMGIRFQGGEDKPEPQFVEALKLMVDHGANVNAANDRGDTAMHGAAQRGANLIVQFLADHGAKMDVKNKQNRTPLDVAMGVGGVAQTGGIAHPETAELIQRLTKGPSAKVEAPAAKVPSAEPK